MSATTRTVVFDHTLQVEAYSFTGYSNTFPTHFHPYYVIGLIETGKRLTVVNQTPYQIGPGDMLTFNPMD